MFKEFKLISSCKTFHLCFTINESNEITTPVLRFYKDGKELKIDPLNSFTYSQCFHKLITYGDYDFVKEELLASYDLDVTTEQLQELIEIFDESRRLSKTPLLMFMRSDSDSSQKVFEKDEEISNKEFHIFDFADRNSFSENKIEDKARRYNSGKRQWGLLDYPSIEELIKVLEYGAFKYSIFEDIETKEQFSGKDLLEQDPNIQSSLAMKNYNLISSGKNNWRKGLDDTEILESSMRHLVELMKGNNIDEESGLLHCSHVMCNMMFWNYNQGQKA